MSIAHMSYVRCDRCGNPGPCHDDAKEARQGARLEGFKRYGNEDVCRFCVAKADVIPCQACAAERGEPCRPDCKG